MTDSKVDAAKYAPVLERTVEILGAEGGEKLTFGAALKRASEELGIEVPERWQQHILTLAFQMVLGGIPGAPDA